MRQVTVDDSYSSLYRRRCSRIRRHNIRYGLPVVQFIARTVVWLFAESRVVNWLTRAHASIQLSSASSSPADKRYP